MKLPLSGYRVISAEQYGAGPYGTMHLAQLGAEVIKIEPPRKNGRGGGDTARAVGPHFLRQAESVYFHAFNLNKKSLTLDLRSDEGRAIFEKLAASSHVVANNLRGDLPEKLGLTYNHLKDLNPALVCAHLSAYGRDNERASRPGYDFLMQAEAGYCSVTGDPGDDPVRMGLSMVDFMTGTIFTIGLLAALVDAERTGVGRDVDTDLFAAALHQTSYPALWYMNAGDETGKTPRGAHANATPSQMFKAKDGWMFVACQLPKFWDLLVERMELQTLGSDPRFASNADRLANREVLTKALDEEFSKQSMAHWCDLLEGYVPVAPVYTLADALDNPWVDTIAMRDSVEHPDRDDLQVLASPIKLNGKRPPNRAGPLLGADNDNILSGLGFTQTEIEAFRNKGVI